VLKMADQSLPYVVEYAKSGRSKCGDCDEKIFEGDLRMGSLEQVRVHLRHVLKVIQLVNTSPNSVPACVYPNYVPQQSTLN
jgi:hypothetical protein